MLRVLLLVTFICCIGFSLEQGTGGRFVQNIDEDAIKESKEQISRIRSSNANLSKQEVELLRSVEDSSCKLVFFTTQLAGGVNYRYTYQCGAQPLFRCFNLYKNIGDIELANTSVSNEDLEDARRRC